MRILLLIDDYLPHSTKIGAKMMHELGMALADEGHLVSVATPDHRIDKKLETEVLDGVNIHRFRSPNVKAESKSKRAINETLLSYNAWKNLKSVLLNNPCDLIIYYSPSIFFGPLVSKLKKEWGAKSYLVLRDLFPQWVIDNGMIRERSAIAAYFRNFEKINYKSADKIGLQSPKNLQIFNSRFGLEGKTEVLFNWSSELPIQTTRNTFREKYGLKNKIVLFYGGNMGKAQDMMNLVRLTENLSQNKNVHFVFAGSGNEFALINRAIEDKKLKNILLLDPVPQDVYRKMLSEFDIGLFTLHPKHSTHNFPGKLLGYLAQGLPILGSVNPGNDVIDVINDGGAGFVCANGDDQQLLHNAQKLITNVKLRKRQGKNSLDLLKSTFSVNAAIQTILAEVESNKE